MKEAIKTAMNTAMQSLGISAVESYETTVKNLHSRITGKHRGIYIPYSSLVAYYVGIATEGNTINERFQPHYAKFTANLPALYGGQDRPKKETRWQFPRNWRKGVREHFLMNEDAIPDYWIGRQKKEVIHPANLDWKPVFKPGVDIDNISVLVWNLDHLTSQQIDTLETLLVQALKPVFNGAKTKKKNG